MATLTYIDINHINHASQDYSLHYISYITYLPYLPTHRYEPLGKAEWIKGDTMVMSGRKLQRAGGRFALYI